RAGSVGQSIDSEGLLKRDETRRNTSKRPDFPWLVDRAGGLHLPRRQHRHDLLRVGRLLPAAGRGLRRARAGGERLLGPPVRRRRLLAARRPRRRPARRTPGRDRGRARAGGGLPHALARPLARRLLPLPRRSGRARLDLHRSAAAHASPADLALVEHEIERSIRPEVAFRQANFWLMAAAFSLTMAGLASVLLYQMPLLVDRGLPESVASLVLGATAAMGVVGKLGFGALLDRFDQRRVAAVCFCLQSAGVLLLWTTRSMPLLACYVVLYGYAMGGNATLFASLNAAAFGRLHYGAIAGRMSPFLVLAQAIGVPATGYLRDHTGSFGPVLATVTVASLLAAAIVLRVR